MSSDTLVRKAPEAASSERKALNLWAPLEALSAALLAGIMVLMLVSSFSRYVFSLSIVWADEFISIAFLWLAMLGCVIAMRRNEHLRLTVFLEKASPALRGYIQAFAIIMVAVCLAALVSPSIEYAQEEWFITSPALGIPNTYRVAAIPLGICLMLLTVLGYALRTVGLRQLVITSVLVVAVAGLLFLAQPVFQEITSLGLLVFLIGLVALCLVAGVPIAFCFAMGTLGYLTFSSYVPLMVVISRMDEGMSSVILVSVPIFVMLGCILDATGMGKAIVDFLGSLLGHVKAGMSYVLLGSLFIVSGISGSKVSDMATVAPALFPEMKRRGNKPKEMIALLGTGAAMADTVPPSIVLIVLGSVAGVSIAALFQAGFVVALVLLMVLLVLARWKARHEDVKNVQRAGLSKIAKLSIIAAPALLLPFLIRGAVGSGMATATEVSTIAVLYTLVVGQLLYGGIGVRKTYGMLVETASLSGTILLILGTASAMAWAITQSGVVQSLSAFLTNLPGGWVAYMAVTIVVFLFLGCILEGLPALLLLAPIMFPIARDLGIHEIQYAMVAVTAMNIGLMLPPLGVGFYVVCRIGGEQPDEVMGAILPYLGALLIGLIIIALVPAISTFAI